MDLREKFITDLFEVMHEMDKGIPRFKEMAAEDKRRSLLIGEGMVNRGWHFDAEKGKE